MLSIIREYVNNHRSEVEIVLAVIFTVLIAYATYAAYESHKAVPIANIPYVGVDTVKTGLAADKITVNNIEAAHITDKIESAVKKGNPEYAAYVGTEAQGDAVIAKVSKADKADAVLKEKVVIPGTAATSTSPAVDSKTEIQYYGIHMEKKTAIGIYADVDTSGSAGIHIRREKVVVEVGKKYKDQSVTGRVAWEVAQF